MSSLQKLKKIHFTAVESNSMADLAIALKQAGHSITGSGTGFNADLKAKLLINNIIDDKSSWAEEKIHAGLEAVVVGQSAKSDNPEVKKANDLKVPVYSLADFNYHLSKDQQRIVIAGSTGKATIILMIIHVLNFHKRKFDYIISSSSVRVSTQIKISNAPLIIIEGQDVMDSTTDRTPALLKYHHHIGLISGIEWQKSDSYPTKEEYTPAV